MAAERHAENVPVLIVRSDQPLVVATCTGDDAQLCYFADDLVDNEADSAPVAQAALDAIGSWSDLDWDDVETELDRIRHESTPTPPIEL
jgi:hypothetical protein